MQFASDASESIEVCLFEELTPGIIRKVRIGQSHWVGVVRVDDRAVVFGSICPHRGGPLTLGMIRNSVTADKPGEMMVNETQQVLTCPWHNWEFDLETGRALYDRSTKILLYPSEVTGGYVRIWRDRLRVRRGELAGPPPPSIPCSGDFHP